ncbi:ester cyclase [Naasia sp. SYSU D00057]|uniref:ester cyclase n=1 Tax=Naasia sp. SYSU D00057 TaxID=2817380 RepID=UPI001B3127B6|nr:nuclear transport factor 2 family protein [Naasia sp. SYSU D00057]
MSNEENFELVRRFNQIWSADDLGILDELLAPDFVAHNGDEEVHGPDGWRQFVLAGREQYGAISTGIDELIGDGGLVGERWWIRGGTGDQSVGGHGMTMHRIADGKLQENWAVFLPDS